MRRGLLTLTFFFFNDTATTEIYTLSLHDALPISLSLTMSSILTNSSWQHADLSQSRSEDRKSTRLNSSHGYISYAVFCLKKKKQPSYSTPWPRRLCTTWSPNATNSTPIQATRGAA